MDDTQQLAKHIANLKLGSIPQKNLEDMKVLLLDFVGVALCGSQMDNARIVAEFSRDIQERPEATIIGCGYKVSAASAAFCNAISSHSIELDDTDDLAYFHFSPPTFSVGLAMGERQKVSGKTFLTAVMGGCDLMARLSTATNPMLRDRGFHTTAVLGVFGAAAVAGKMLGLSEEQQTSAFGLAGAQASGLMEMYGVSMQKRFNPGPAARNGIISALLAQRGYTGAETILEGERGVCRSFAGVTDLTKLTENLGRDFPVHVEYKPYACARPIHNAIDCTLELRRKFNPSPDDIDEVLVRRHPAWAHYHTTTQPRTHHEAQMSLPYSVAIAFFEGKAFPEQYSDEKLKDTRIIQMAAKVKISSDPSLPRGVSCAMEMRMKDGVVYESQTDYAKGSRENPMTDRELREKFNSLASVVLSEGKREAVISIVEKLEDVEDVSKLCELLC
ncbi:MmgE/PrpD family protein [Chloroflexota bacterium]